MANGDGKSERLPTEMHQIIHTSIVFNPRGANDELNATRRAFALLQNAEGAARSSGFLRSTSVFTMYAMRSNSILNHNDKVDRLICTDIASHNIYSVVSHKKYL